MNYGQAFEEVKKGKGMRLPQWSPEVVIRAQYPDEHSKMTAPYLYAESRFGRVPWKETNIELFAENWEVVE
ncbi:Thoeris anti-defense Tad2 family protein [Bacillus pretiosus]|uniref:Thoeris anti-defense Tad2 family protein n=1 Tax=Bacillus pretiosus TaxID=2983392 RepID=UPI003D6528BB